MKLFVNKAVLVKHLHKISSFVKTMKEVLLFQGLCKQKGVDGTDL